MIPFAAVDPHFAKEQLLLLLREWYMHPNGQLPAYEWNFSDVNPPVHAWAVWRVYKIADPKGQRDLLFLDQSGASTALPDLAVESIMPLHDARDDFERQYILRALAAQHGNISRTADALGVERSNLYRKMRAFGIAPRVEEK